MGWESDLSDTIKKTAPYAFGFAKVVDPEEMDNVCRYVVQQTEGLMLKLAKYMHWQGVLAGIEAAGGKSGDFELDPSLDTFYSEEKFREWERKVNDSEISLATA